MRLGIIGSSGGSALRAAAQICAKANIKAEITVLADRICGLTEWATQARHEVFVREYVNAEDFSTWADGKFTSAGCNDVLLFYTRRVSSPLIDCRNVLNIHPALLPSFKGLSGVNDALTAGVALFGATLHQVDAGLDTGPIVAQICSAVPVPRDRQRANRISYIHKVWLTLLWIEGVRGRLVAEPVAQTWNHGIFLASHGIQSESLAREFEQWLARADLDT